MKQIIVAIIIIIIVKIGFVIFINCMNVKTQNGVLRVAPASPRTLRIWEEPRSNMIMKKDPSNNITNSNQRW